MSILWLKFIVQPYRKNFLSVVKKTSQAATAAKLSTIGSVKYLFFLKMLKKKLLNIFLKFLFLFESTMLPLNNGK